MSPSERFQQYVDSLPEPEPPRICLLCGQPHFRSNPRVKYCGSVCADAASRARRKNDPRARERSREQYKAKKEQKLQSRFEMCLSAAKRYGEVSEFAYRWFEGRPEMLRQVEQEAARAASRGKPPEK